MKRIVDLSLIYLPDCCPLCLISKRTMIFCVSFPLSWHSLQIICLIVQCKDQPLTWGQFSKSCRLIISLAYISHNMRLFASINSKREHPLWQSPRVLHLFLARVLGICTIWIARGSDLLSTYQVVSWCCMKTLFSYKLIYHLSIAAL